MLPPPLLLLLLLPNCGLLVCGASADSGASVCAAGLVEMARFGYSVHGGPTVQLAACEDLSRANGSITFVPLAAQPRGAAPSPFPLTLTKALEANSGDDNQFLGNLTKEQVMNAPSDIMGNRLLGIHGFPPRGEPTLSEVKAAVSPIRPTTRGNVAVWTATREATVDAVFSPTADFATAGTPDPQHASKVLPGLRSPSFEQEGLLGGDLPILVLNYPTRASRSDDSTVLREAVEQVQALRAELEEAVAGQRYADAAAIQERMRSARRWASTAAAAAGTVVGGGAAAQGANCTYVAGHDWNEGHSSGTSHPASSKEGCCAACAATAGCAASVFELPSNCEPQDALSLAS